MAKNKHTVHATNNLMKPVAMPKPGKSNPMEEKGEPKKGHAREEKMEHGTGKPKKC